MTKKIFSLLVVLTTVYLLSGLYNINSTEDNAKAAVSSWQKSASIVPTSTTDFSSQNFRSSLDQLKGDNANFVTLIIPYYQSNTGSTDIQRGWNTPTDESLVNAINYAHSIGLQVALKPHMETFAQEWRAYINPGDRNSWFSAYGDMLDHYAGIAQANNAELFILGSELISMAADSQHSSNTQNWQNMIQSVRSIYSGPITYSANWGPSGFVNEKDDIAFWGELDYIGIAAYFTLGFDWGDHSVETLRGHWSNWDSGHIAPLQQRWNKPVLFTEIGYRSVDGAHTDPFDSGRGGGVNQQVQADAYEALFSYWNEKPYMVGVHLWDWQPDPNAGGPGTTTYTPQNKTAEGVMSDWFGRTSNGTPPPPPPPSEDLVFDISGSVDPSSAQPGDQVALSMDITAMGGSASNILVNMEVHNESGEKVFQEVFSGESIASGGTKTYQSVWTLPEEGTFTLKAGIFSNDWSTLHEWHNEVATINSEDSGDGNGETPPSGSEEMDVWWPTDGGSVSGTQPFKALLNNMALSNYEMFWQVDFDRLNPMFNSQEDWPHKEALVDVSGWSWKNSGPYVVNFVAKSLGGSTLAEKAIEILIAR